MSTIVLSAAKEPRGSIWDLRPPGLRSFPLAQISPFLGRGGGISPGTSSAHGVSPSGLLSEASTMGHTAGEVCSWKNVGDFVTKAGFQFCSFQSSKGSGWRMRRDKGLKKRKKNNTDHLEASHWKLEDFRSKGRAIGRVELLPPSPSPSTMVHLLQALQPHGERHSSILRCLLYYLL